MEWWQRAVVLQIYPRSYQDSDGDGVGDLRGLCSRLEYLEWLGVDALWLSPTFPSPNDDWGYDVADYRGVHPELGTLEDMDALLAEAEARGHPGPPRPRPEPHLGAAPVVPRRAPRLVRLGRSGARRRPAQQLAVGLRRLGVGVVGAGRALLPPQLPALDARPRLVERGRARRVRGHPPLLVRPRRRGLPDRRRARPRPRPAAARQLAGRAGRLGDAAAHGPAARPQPQPAGGARRLPRLARGWRTGTSRPGRSSARRT